MQIRFYSQLKFLFVILPVFILNACVEEETPIDYTNAACFEILNDSFLTGDTIGFINCSENATEYIWDFGDGERSNSESPVHVYYSSGNYEVILIAKNEFSSDTITKEIAISDKYSSYIFYH